MGESSRNGRKSEQKCSAALLFSQHREMKFGINLPFHSWRQLRRWKSTGPFVDERMARVGEGSSQRSSGENGPVRGEKLSAGAA